MGETVSQFGSTISREAPFGALVGGLLAEVIGIRPTVAIAAAGGLLEVVWLVCSPLPHLHATQDLETGEVPGAGRQLVDNG